MKFGCHAAAITAILTAPLFAAEGPDVQVVNTTDAVTMQNGLVTAVIDKKSVRVSSITMPGSPNLLRGGITFDAEAVGGGGKKEIGLAGSDGVIVSQGPDVAEVKFVDPNFCQFLTAEMHYVMKRGVPGIYEYLVMKHGPGQPTGRIGQLRWVFRGDGSLLNHAYASSTKQGPMMEGDAMRGSTMIADATFRLTPEAAAAFYKEPVGHTHDGAPVYSKYDWTDYVENHVVHGFSSDTNGIFMVQPSMEYYNGGPTKGILTVHNGPVGILEFLGGHFLIRDHVGVELSEGQQWQQIIGPWLAYLNKGENPHQLWVDAAARGEEEKAAWPYDFVHEDEALYPHERGTVTGGLRVPEMGTAHALVVLAAGDRDWQVQTMGYEFWTRADGNGRFTIPKVRPGEYALYASVPGVVGELKIPSVKVTAGGTTDLGTIEWQAPRRQQLLWRVGTPDRSTSEFKYGDEPRQFGLWWRYMKEMGTRELNYQVEYGDSGKDWYYAQCVVPMPDGTYFSPTWNIDFNVTALPGPGKLALTVDLAGACGGDNRLNVSVNGTPVGVIVSPNDSGIYRSAVRSADFRHNVIEFDAGLLKKGQNKVSLKLDAKGNWKSGAVDSVIATQAGAMPEVPSEGVMYDCIQLEAGPVTGDGSYRILGSP
jgi:rhamnogalacturonan endolyase